MPPKRQDAKAMQRNKVSQFEQSPKKLTGPSRKTPRDLNREEKRQLLVATVRREKKERIKKNQKPVGTRYRRTKRLRPCVFYLIFLVSLGIILLERYLGSLFKLEDFKHAYYDHLGIDPWQAETPARARVSTVRPILELTAPSEISSCGIRLRWIDNVHNPKSHSTRYRKIPMVVHQTSQSRCLTRNFERAAREWATLPGWSYYFHDDSAVDNLLESDFPEFPHLKLVLSRCLDSHSARLDLWRYLVLWEYGGLYIDLNQYPTNFNETTIRFSDDGFFLLDSEAKWLTTKIMAVSPRHPLMYYAVQHSINNLLRIRNDRFVDPHVIIGEENLHRALIDFQKGANGKAKSHDEVSTGIIAGFGDRSIRVAGNFGGREEYLTPVFIGEVGKKAEFAKFGVDLKNDIFHVGNCFHDMLGRQDNNYR